MTATGYGSAATPDLMPEPAPARTKAPRQRNRGAATRWIVLIVCGIYFIGPLFAAFAFTVKKNGGGISFSAYSQIFAKQPGGQIGIQTALLVSLELAVIAIVLTLALMLPTMLLLHLKFRKVRPIVEIITLLPLVFPPVVLVVGVSGHLHLDGQPFHRSGQRG